MIGIGIGVGIDATLATAAEPEGPTNLIDNGTFDDATGWALAGTSAPTISGGTLNATGAGTAARNTNAAITEGNFYKVTGDLTVSSGSVQFFLGGRQTGWSSTASGPFTTYLQAGATQELLINLSGDAVVDNVILTDATAVLGADIVQNGGFADDTNWTLAPTVTVSGGTVNWSSSLSNRSATNTPLTPVEPGEYYLAAFDITSRTGGAIRPSVGVGSAGRTFNSVGSFTEFMRANDTTGPRLLCNGTTTLSADNFVVNKVTFS